MLIALKILAVLVLVFANGFFVAAEFAFVGVRRSRVESLASGGDKRAQRLLSLLDNLNAYLSASQLGITLASLALGWIGEPVVAHLLEGPLAGRISEFWLHTISFFIAFVVITSLHIVLGEQAPKLLGLERAESVSLMVAWPMQIFYKMFSWPIRALDWASAYTVRIFGLHPTAEHASLYTEEELRQIINASHKGGFLDAHEQRLINSVFDFANAAVREAMIPRINIVAVPFASTLDEIEEAFCEHGYSRLPVYRERLDEIVGVLFLKDILTCRRKGAANFKIEKILHAPMFTPATASLGSVLAQMQTEKMHLAFVIDEHGGIEGIVTLEDLLEEIVGEINDEYDEEVREQIVKEDDSYVLDGMLAVRDANRHFKLGLPEEAGYTTIAGFLLAKAGRLLRQGETVEHDGASFTVERIERRRIRRIRFRPTVGGQGQRLAALLPLVCSTVAAAFA